MNASLTIRPAELGDLDAITAIYNDAIATTTATFDTEPKTAAEQEKWFVSHGARHPIFVAEIDGQVAGWAALSEWSGRCAYADTAETSIYVRSDFRGRGIGRMLKRGIIDRSTSAQVSHAGRAGCRGKRRQYALERESWIQACRQAQGSGLQVRQATGRVSIATDVGVNEP